jgi:hypothetical protein
MFAALKSLMSNHLAPGASQVTFAPFSFGWLARVYVYTKVSSDVEHIDEVLRMLEQSQLDLESDNLVGGRGKLANAIELLRQIPTAK